MASIRHKVPEQSYQAIVRRLLKSAEFELKSAEFEFQMVERWLNSDDAPLAPEHWHRALTLIEFLEVEHCGLSGGFGEWNEERQESMPKYQSVKGRLKWLKKVFRQTK